MMMDPEKNGNEADEYGKRKRPARKRISRARGVRKTRRRTARHGADRRIKRGVYLLPGLFTVSNLFAGFLSIIFTMQFLAVPEEVRPEYFYKLEVAALLIGLAILLDGLDGRIARLTGATSQFGTELDSLADMLSFGAAPALLVYVWGLSSLDRIGWLTSFIFVVCCAARLARFNIRVESSAADAKFFVGLPSPMAAFQLATIVFFAPEPVRSRVWAVGFMIITVAVSYLMVSKFKYHSFKRVGTKSRRSYIFVVFLGLVFVAVAAAPKVVLLGLAMAYVLSGPVLWLASLPAVRRQRRHTADVGTAGANGKAGGDGTVGVEGPAGPDGTAGVDGIVDAASAEGGQGAREARPGGVAGRGEGGT